MRKPVHMTAEEFATKSYNHVAASNPGATPAQIKEIVAPYMRRLIQSGLIVIA